VVASASFDEDLAATPQMSLQGQTMVVTGSGTDWTGRVTLSETSFSDGAAALSIAGVISAPMGLRPRSNSNFSEFAGKGRAALTQSWGFSVIACCSSNAEIRMSMNAPIKDVTRHDFVSNYLESLSMVERLHRLLLDVIKDEFERLGHLDLNSVQALLLFNIGDHEVTAGELKSRGYYQGSNVSYNLKKLVDMGYMHHQRCEIDRRSVRVRLTEKGREVRDVVRELFARHAQGLAEKGVLGPDGVGQINHSLKRLERYWTDQIRYIY